MTLTVRNPILPGDYSDPDVIRVGEDYYLITSTFQYSPGMAILHSRDLVHWRHIGHAIPDLTAIGPELNWDRMTRYGRGVYAGALRHHAGRFWLFFTTLEEGVFMTTAPHPTGPWEPVHRLWDGKGLFDASYGPGWDDPCPLWDDDGRAWLLLSNPGKAWQTRMFAMSPDGRSIDLASHRVIDPHQTSEGNKIYRINGWYYVFHNEVRDERLAFYGDQPRGERVGVMMRSRSIDGPWEKRLILAGRSPADLEPNQGALIDSPDGRWWFITHQGTGGYEGRASHLLPVEWVDGWPIPGERTAEGWGALMAEVPHPAPTVPPAPETWDDDFTTTTLRPVWEWNFQPRASHWSLSERPVHLRLRASRPLKPGDFSTAANTLTQRVLGRGNAEARVTLDGTGMTIGQTAGLTVFWKFSARLGLDRTPEGWRVVFAIDRQRLLGPLLDRPVITLIARMVDGRVQFAYHTGGDERPFGPPMPLGWHFYRGTRVGLYSWCDGDEGGAADFSAFRHSLA